VEVKLQFPLKCRIHLIVTERVYVILDYYSSFRDAMKWIPHELLFFENVQFGDAVMINDAA
jgi:hypothetical protein